ncbi:MAG: beta-ketoacyl synthase N-terminal-like domain-containing protein [Armatimonadota bacterium]
MARADLRRIVVTGVGAIHGLGVGAPPLIEALRAGGEPDEDLLAADYDPEDYRESPKTYMDPCSDLVLAACYLAVRDANLGWQGAEHPGFESDRLGVSLGTAFGTTASMLSMTGRVQQKGLRFGSPMIFTHAFINTPAALASIEYELQGPNMTHSLGDASAAAAFAYALTMMRGGRADLMLAGGAEALSDPVIAVMDERGVAGVLGEGAAMLILETAECASNRGARPLAELTGASCLAPCADGGGEAVLAAGADGARVIDASPACGHTFGASVALSAACCVGMLTDGAGEPLAAVAPDGSGAVVLEEWRE